MRNFKFTMGAGILAATLCSALAQAAVPRYKVEPIGDGAGFWTATALNNLGQVAGTQLVGEGGYVPYIFQNGHLTRPAALQPLNLFTIGAINDHGDLGGSFFRDGNFYPFVWRDGKLNDLAAGQGPGHGQILSINEAGHAVGYLFGEQGGFRSMYYDGNRLHIEPFIDLSYVDINDHDVIVHSKGFIVDHGNFEFVPRLDEQHGANYLRAINNAGQVVGRSVGLDGAATEAFIYSHGHMKTLGSIGGSYAFGMDINDKGWVVGEALTQQGDLDAFLYRDSAMRNVEDLLRPRDQGLWDFSGAVKVNERGQILVTLDPNGPNSYRNALLTPVPEAQSWALMLAGLGVVGAAARRRRPAPVSRAG